MNWNETTPEQISLDIRAMFNALSEHSGRPNTLVMSLDLAIYIKALEIFDGIPNRATRRKFRRAKFLARHQLSIDTNPGVSYY